MGISEPMPWRTDTPHEVQDDLDRLADEALSAARELLAAHGEFYPFGLRLPATGDVELFNADPVWVSIPRREPCWIS
jgi:hypothetical protein